MRMAPASHRAYTYKVTIPPAELPVTLAEFKMHANITHDLLDSLLLMYIGAATTYAENYTRRDLITRTYVTYRDFFPSPGLNEGYYSGGRIPSGQGSNQTAGNVGFELRRSPLQSITEITYTNVLNAVDTVPVEDYYNTLEEDYSEVLSSEYNSWPQDSINRQQSISITFKTGIGDTEADIPSCWKIAIMEHVMSMYANRGDCSGCGDMVPSGSKSLYSQKRILNL